MQSRPWIEEHGKMFRWYDYWIKGIDNGVMDAPPVSVFVEGSREYVTGNASDGSTVHDRRPAETAAR